MINDTDSGPSLLNDTGLHFIPRHVKQPGTSGDSQNEHKYKFPVEVTEENTAAGNAMFKSEHQAIVIDGAFQIGIFADKF